MKPMQALKGRVRIILFVLAGMLWVSTASAAELGTLKADGIVGERADGYIGQVQATAEADVRALIQSVNAKRRAEYERIAAQHGIALSEVEALAGKKTLAKTAPGQWIFIESWRQK